MTANLWSSNTPARFWLLESAENGEPALSPEEWRLAISRSVHVLDLPALPQPVEQGRFDVDELLDQTLGEGQFGPDHWCLSRAKRAYYTLKPFLPRAMTRLLRRLTTRSMQSSSGLSWPIEDRYARFQWEIARQLLVITGRSSLSFHYFWPHGRGFALVLTHDVETAAGQAYVRTVAGLEESLGFRSSFNFVPERYALDRDLLAELRQRGFEVGVHGLKHDGKLFRSHVEWTRRVANINSHLHQLGAGGFRAPLTHRHPEWMQDLEVDYDLSFFDTDPYEPVPGGTMSIWPFQLGHFLELPYTLAQDYTLTSVLGEETPRLWLEKVDFLRQYHGMALLNSHPDYLREERTWAVYVAFLEAMVEGGGYWHALPGEVAHWWRERASITSFAAEAGDPHLGSMVAAPRMGRGEIRLEAGVLVVAPGAGHQVQAEKGPLLVPAGGEALGPDKPHSSGIQR
jgi:hypothetical protein